MKTYDMIKQEIAEQKAADKARIEYILDNITDEQRDRFLSKVRTGMGIFIGKCEKLGLVDEDGNVDSEKCHEFFNKTK